MRIEHIDIEGLLELHKIVCEPFGSPTEVRDIELLQYCVDAPFQEVFGCELYPSLFDKAAKLAESFAKYQIFVDGNKRTGIMACMTMLELNGYSLELTNDELYQLGMRIANDSAFDWKSISDYLEENSAPILEREVDFQRI